MITIKIPGGGHITTHGVDADKIKEGFDFTIKKDKIKIGKMYTEATNKWQLEKEVEKATTIEELKGLMIKIIELQ